VERWKLSYASEEKPLRPRSTKKKGGGKTVEGGAVSFCSPRHITTGEGVKGEQGGRGGGKEGEKRAESKKTLSSKSTQEEEALVGRFNTTIQGTRQGKSSQGLSRDKRKNFSRLSKRKQNWGDFYITV